MKNRTGRFLVLLPFLITLSLYMVFNSKISCKPHEAGFWIVFVLGISIGVAITSFLQWSKTIKKL